MGRAPQRWRRVDRERTGLALTFGGLRAPLSFSGVSMRTVWSFQPISELNFQTGFVSCDNDTATLLIADGKAQNPMVGGWLLKFIEDAPTVIDPPQPDPIVKKKSGRKAKPKDVVIDVDSDAN